MVNVDKARAALLRMDAAKAALDRYLQKPVDEPEDHERHMRLADELKRATDEYIAVLAEP